MIGRAPFATVLGEPNPPSTDPIALLNYALLRHPESVVLVNFAGTVKAVALPDLVETGLRGVVIPPPALLTVEAPFEIGRNLAEPPEEQDAYLLIHIPRAIVDEMDSPVERPLIVLPPGAGRIS